MSDLGADRAIFSLRCQVCGAVQPVTTPDEADEDPRTLAIRRAFRAEHAAQCGPTAIRFESATGSLEPAEVVEPQAWEHSSMHPADVILQADGLFVREIVRDGVTQRVRVCEACWSVIPRYVEFQFGLVSPDSDGDAQGNGAKRRRATVEGRRGWEHLRKVVCLPCYLAVFQAVYPGAALPELSSAVIGDGTPVEPPPPPPEEMSPPDPLRQVSA
jgi:hypothetical protein